MAYNEKLEPLNAQRFTYLQDENTLVADFNEFIGNELFKQIIEGSVEKGFALRFSTGNVEYFQYVSIFYEGSVKAGYKFKCLNYDLGFTAKIYR